MTNGWATLTTGALAAGTHTITAAYSGDAAFIGTASPPVAQAVAPVPTSTRLSSCAS